MQDRQFTNEEMRAILSRALRQKYKEGNHIARGDLEQAATELGIDKTRLDAAIEDFDRDRKSEVDSARVRKRKRNTVVMHGVVFVMVNSALLFDMALRGRDYPMHWILLGWGIGLIAHILQDWFGWEFEEGKRKRH